MNDLIVVLEQAEKVAGDEGAELINRAIPAVKAMAASLINAGRCNTEQRRTIAMLRRRVQVLEKEKADLAEMRFTYNAN